jgi:hypothetical protein
VFAVTHAAVWIAPAQLAREQNQAAVLTFQLLIAADPARCKEAQSQCIDQ